MFNYLLFKKYYNFSIFTEGILQLYMSPKGQLDGLNQLALKKIRPRLSTTLFIRSAPGTSGEAAAGALPSPARGALEGLGRGACCGVATLPPEATGRSEDGFSDDLDVGASPLLAPTGSGDGGWSWFYTMQCWSLCFPSSKDFAH
jgi:hypothetical protein